jgi:ribosome-associated protein
MLRAKNNDKNGNFTNLYKNNSWQKKTINNDDLLSIIKGIEEVKGNDINILDLRDIDTSVCDYFVICNGNSKHRLTRLLTPFKKTVSKN